MKSNGRSVHVWFAGFLMAVTVCGIVMPSVAHGQEALLDASGRLEYGHDKLPKGEFHETHTFEAKEGQSLSVVMTSDDFDTYLIVRGPAGRHYINDDWEGRTDMSRVDLVAPESGEWTAIASSFAVGEVGDYALRVLHVDTPAAPSPPEPGRPGTLLRRSGWLTPGGATLPKGEFFEEYGFNVAQDQKIRVTVTSGDFDTFLIVRGPDGQQWVNDDWGGGTDSRIDVAGTEAGEWTAVVTSFGAGETGRFELQVEQLDAAEATEAAPVPGTEATLLEESGRLDASCETLPGGEYFNTYTFQVESGQSIRVVMTSDSFDTYLVVTSPSGRPWENDDWQGRTDMSRLDLVTTERGTWTVTTTSYAAGETGPYNLRVEQTTDKSAEPERPMGADSF